MFSLFVCSFLHIGIIQDVVVVLADKVHIRYMIIFFSCNGTDTLEPKCKYVYFAFMKASELHVTVT